MNVMVTLETQGISDDWSRSNGDFETLSRGMLEHEQVFSALHHASLLPEPPGDDSCPPHVLIDGPAGSFSFVGQQGKLYCPEVERDLRADEAASLAFGMVTAEQLVSVTPKVGSPPPPINEQGATVREGGEAPPSVKRTRSKAERTASILGVVAGAALGGGVVGGADAAREAAAGAVLGATASSKDGSVRIKKQFTWRTWIGLLLGTGFVLTGLVSIAGIEAATRSSNEEDLWAALIITCLLVGIGIAIVVLALKSRQAVRVDDQGVVLGVTMAHLMNTSDSTDLWDNNVD